MAGKGKAVGNVVKYAVKYGPHVVAAAKLAKEPAQAAAQRALANQRAKRAALAQAATLADGSVLKVFHGEQQVWAVFSGEDVIATHPAVPGIPVDALLAHADLSRRVRPDELPSAADKVKGMLPRGKG